MKKAIPIIAIIISLMCIFALTGAFMHADAANSTVYLSSVAVSGADGSEQKPFNSLDDAIKAVKNGGTVVIKDKFTVQPNGTVGSVPAYTEPAHTGKITFCSVNGSKDYRNGGAGLCFPKSMAYMMSGPVKFEKTSFSSDGHDVFAAAQFNAVEYGDGFEVKNTKNTNKYLFAIGGYYAPAKANLPANLSSNITIRSGDFAYVFGFAYVKGTKTYTFTGTAKISVYGGNIGTVYGGSALNHYSGSLDFEMYGGSINTLFTAGDQTRRLDGNAKVSLMGGTLNNLRINNVIGDVSLTLDATKLQSVQISYASDTIKDLSYASRKTLKYNSVFYSPAFIATVKGFDTVERYGTVYVSSKGTGDGLTATSPLGRFEEAVKLIGARGGDIRIDGTMEIGSFAEPVHSESIRILGGKLKINGDYTLGGDTEFDSCNIDITGDFDANSHTLVFGEDITVEGAPDVYSCKSGASGGRVMIKGGSFGNVYAPSVASGEWSFEMLGGSVASVYLNYDKPLRQSFVSISSGKVSEIVTKADGGSVEKIVLELSCEAGKVNVTTSGTFELTLGTCKISELTLSLEKSKSTLVYDKSGIDEQSIDKIKDKFSSVSDRKTVYVSDGGDGNGFSRLHPAPDLKTAAEKLSDGGNLVLAGDVTVSAEVVLPKANGKIYVSSENGAKLMVGSNITFDFDVDIDNITIMAIENGKYLIFNGHNAHVGKNITSEKEDGITQYVGLIGGSTKIDYASSVSSLTIDGGIWQQLRGGSSFSTYYIDAKYSLTVNGGEFYGRVICSGSGTILGDAEATFNGGTFFSNVYGTATAQGSESFTGNLSIRINGGNFYGKILPSVNKSSVLNGAYDVYVNGGDFVHLTDIKGCEGYVGNAKSNIHIGEGVDIEREEQGNIEYTNPIRRTADARIALVDGMYYYVFTSGATLSVYKAANITDLAYSVGELVWDARQYSDALEGRISNIWPSELQYFSAEEFGEEYEGWYLFYSTYKPETTELGSSDGQNRRSYVLKCASNDLQGKWINPVTGEEGVPQPFCSDTYDWVNKSDWTAGESTLRYNGEVYALWIGQTGRMTAQFKQTMYLSKLKNPWTVTGEILELVNPEYDWERVGYGYDAAANIWYPAVIEGATPLVSDDNKLYVLYAASGYWTTAYSLGQMTHLGGDLLDINNWKKNPTPIFSKNSEVNGVGGPSLITMPDGVGRYIMYHGYIGSDTSSGRFCFLEPYTIDENGVHIGVNGHPSPLSTVLKIPVNTAKLATKISGFDNYKEYVEPEDPVDIPDAVPDIIDGKNDPTIILTVAAVILILALGFALMVVIDKKMKGNKK